MTLNNRSTLLLQLFIVFAAGILLTMASRFGNEIIQINDGFGYDGKHYAGLAADYPGNITKATDAKYFQRSMPSFVVYVTGRALGLSPTPKSIILLFSVYNLLLLLLGVYAWNRIVDVSGLNMKANWFGFSALFLSFASLKFSFFYPTLTDVTGFVLSVFLVLYYKTNNKPAILLVMLLGALSWPAIEYMCLALLFFKNSTPIIASTRSTVFNTLIAFLIGLAFTGLGGYLIYKHPQMRGGWLEHTWLVKHAIIPSLLATFTVIFLSFRILLRRLDLSKIPVLKIIDFTYAVAGIVLFLAIDISIKTLSRKFGIPAGYSLRMYFNDMLIIGSRQPFCFLVGHLAYFGPLLGLCILRWEKICQLIYKSGWGLFFLAVQFLFFMLDSESRHILNYVPFVIWLLVQVMQDQLSKQWLIIGATLSLLFSKVWISIFTFPTNSWSDNYNVNFGCYLTDAAYLLQLFIFVLICILFYYMLKKTNTKTNPAGL